MRYKKNSGLEEELKNVKGIIKIKHNNENATTGYILLKEISFKWLKDRYKYEISNTEWEVRYTSLPPIITKEEIKKYII